MMIKCNLILLYFMVFSLVFSQGVFSSETFPQLTILTEDWEPFNYEEEGTVQGISTDMLVLM
ncbi:MAG: hypothetical protein JEY91_07350, partial [Spirochaetaceae bacterium]|nr:hypothetical protein [Spirochaetaceae bacterium]